MSKLYTLNNSLIQEIKTNIANYSERILLGGLSMRPETQKIWLQNIKVLNETLAISTLQIGNSNVPTFNYLQCNREPDEAKLCSTQMKLDYLFVGLTLLRA